MDCNDAFHGFSCRSINACDFCTSMGAAHERGIGLIFHPDVVGVLAFTSDETLVFLPRNARANSVSHERLPYSAALAMSAIVPAASSMAFTMLW